ncbi:MAG: 1-deoxy-D-xylulose-5-phosphate reductoisomerase [Bacillota bacterium]
MKSLTILGSTGSIGTQTLEVIRNSDQDYKVVALTANQSVDQLAAQAREFEPEFVVMMNDQAAQKLASKLSGLETEVLSGKSGLIKVATLTRVDLVINALVGAVGLEPTLAAIKSGIDIGLANKETLVIAGELVIEQAEENNVQLLPIDSEHNAIFQAIDGEAKESVEQIILTASGGPFRESSADKLAEVTVNEALDHPNWDMGGKITIDSATLMNKGLEVIEAKWLFGVDFDEIEVVVHPQSIIHSLVQFRDGAMLAELGLPDMKVPIQHVLTYPQRCENQLERLDLTEVGQLDFTAPRRDLFPCLDYAYQAGKRGGTLPAVLNAANEVAVAKFLAGEIKFITIPQLIQRVMEKHQVIDQPNLEEILRADQWAREESYKEVETFC